MLKNIIKLVSIQNNMPKQRKTSKEVSLKKEHGDKKDAENVYLKKEHSDKKHAEKITLFYKKESPFSQHYPIKFTIDEVVYNCAEQYMMHQKAVTFGDKKMEDAIMKTTCPKAMKKFGRKVSNFDKDIWKNKSRNVVKKASLAKFSQNRSLRDVLFKTAGTTLAEASPRDRLWGIGLGSSNPNAQNKANWRGKNLLGYILTEVREELMAKDKTVEDEETEK